MFQSEESIVLNQFLNNSEYGLIGLNAYIRMVEENLFLPLLALENRNYAESDL